MGYRLEKHEQFIRPWHSFLGMPEGLHDLRMPQYHRSQGARYLGLCRIFNIKPINLVIIPVSIWFSIPPQP